jgi:hypothetical protein
VTDVRYTLRVSVDTQHIVDQDDVLPGTASVDVQTDRRSRGRDTLTGRGSPDHDMPHSRSRSFAIWTGPA